MKFNDKFPDKTNAQKLFPERMMGPHPEVRADEKIVQTWRVYPCSACKTRTSWCFELADDCPPPHCCSEECQAKILADNATLTEEHVKEAFDVTETAQRAQNFFVTAPPEAEIDDPDYGF